MLGMEQLSDVQREDCAAQWQRALENALCEETGLRGEIGALLAARILAGLRRALGGEAMYMPKPSKDERNTRIRQQFTGGGRGLERVAWAGLSRSSVYRISKSA